MKKSLITIALLSGTLIINSCKNDKKTAGENTVETVNANQEAAAAALNNSGPKTYALTATPENVDLGKSKEAKVKVSNFKAVELFDPEGKLTGMELSYDIELTNNKAIGEGKIFLNPGDFRLELDNGNKITHDNYNPVTAEAESSKIVTGNKFRLPVGTKPKALHLFYDETRATVSVEIK
ncbi:MAG TPA: hypothetical protein VF677_07795 [Flavobacterium sp.]|jgi:hypothetical protein